MISEERKLIYADVNLLKMTSGKITNPQVMIEKLTNVFIYNAFSIPKDRIYEPGFTKRRCDPAMTTEQIIEARNRADSAIKKIREIESGANAALPATLDLDYQRIAAVIRARHHVISFGGILYRYDDGFYVKDNTGLISSEIVKELSRCEKFDGDDDVSRAAHQVKHYLTYEIVEHEYPFNPKRGAFNVANGIIKLDMVTGAHELIPHSPEYRFNYKLKVRYEKDAPIDAIMKYFETLESDDNKIGHLLTQIPAHCLLSMDGNIYKRAYFLKGEHDSGKSTYIKMLVERFFGEDVCSANSLQELLFDRFRLAELDGKLLNEFADLPSSKLSNTGIFKALTGGDHVTVERKHQDPYRFVNRAVLVFSGNSYPQIEIKGDEEAFWVRWIPIEFKNKFEIDSKYADRVFTETNVSGLLNMVLLAMPKILAEGIKDNGNIMDAWLRDSNSAHEYVGKHLEKCIGAVLVKSKLYQRYVEYCQSNELHVEEQKVFTQTMRAAGYIVDTQQKINSQREHVYADVKLKGDEYAAVYPDRYVCSQTAISKTAQEAQVK